MCDVQPIGKIVLDILLPFLRMGFFSFGCHSQMARARMLYKISYESLRQVTFCRLLAKERDVAININKKDVTDIKLIIQ